MCAMMRVWSLEDKFCGVGSCGFWDLNSGHQGRVVSALPTGPPRQPTSVFRPLELLY